MGYVDKVLVDGEQVLYRARVSWALYLPGFALCLLSLILGWGLPDLDRRWSWLWSVSRAVGQWIPLTHAAAVISYGVFAVGVVWVLKIYTLCAFTELAVTDRRVIAKIGITQTTTIEIDRNKIASVEVHQDVWGQMFRYGRVTLRGFSSIIGHLPPLSRPFDLQKIINTSNTNRSPL
jgi:hypothetical protein